MSCNNTAILIFANSASHEAKNKAFHCSYTLFKNLNELVLNTVKSSNIPYFVYTEKEQIGLNFQEKLLNAIEDVYNKGYDSVITIGNDSPLLNKKHLINAFDELQHKKVVVGKAEDGGIYLLGINKETFEKNRLLNLPWRKNTLNESIKNLFLNSSTEIACLETLSDIDSYEDIFKLFKFKSAFSKVLSIILNSIISFYLNFTSYKRFINYLIGHTTQTYNKGSPIYL